MTGHPLMSWLKFTAFANIYVISVTLLVSQFPMSWLNADAVLNVLFIFVTLLVSHPLISSLKVVFSKNKEEISVIRDVSHMLMGGALDVSRHQLFTAMCMLLFVG